MKLLLIHSDFIEYEVTAKAGKVAEEIAPAQRKGRMEEALVAFVAVEKGDESDAASAVSQAAAEVRKVADQVKAKRVMVYPYAHLSNTLASPSAAVVILKDLATALSGSYEVARSPFGWYKSFSISCKGHPLSELSRHVVVGNGAAAQAAGATVVVTAAREQAKLSAKGLAPPAAPAPPGAAPQAAAEEAHVSEAVKKETKLRRSWWVLTPAGELVEAAKFDFSAHPELAKFHQYEAHGTRESQRAPPHIALMQELELVDYEPGSDSGNFRWYPKGQMVKRLLEEHCANLCRAAGGMQVETPIMYDYEHPALAKYLNRFPARQYVVKSDDKEFFLRFAACFGQYLIMHDATLSYRHLPLRLLEITHFSFRREQRGELAGLKRLRTFTMPDMHTLCTDIPQAKEEFLRHFKLAMGWMADVGLPFEAGVRFVRSFFDEHRDFAVTLAKTLGKPLLIEMWEDRFFYFVMKFEFNVNDALDKAAALSTVQIDVENTERFGITYADREGKKQHPFLLHTSVSGSIDRNVYAILEREHLKKEKGEKPSLPFWLSPTQVRLLPVRDDHTAVAAKLAEEVEAASRAAGHPLRVDVDDRPEGIGRKIRDAEKEWVPIIVVVGDKEASGRFTPRLRTPELEKAIGTGELAAADLARRGAALGARFPSSPLPLPRLITLRPIFRG